MRYHFEKPAVSLSMYGRRYICNHPVYDSCTLFEIDEKGLAVIQQRFDPKTKSTSWTEVDAYLTDVLYLHPKFKEFFDSRARTCTDGLYPHCNNSANHVGAEDETFTEREMGDRV